MLTSSPPQKDAQKPDESATVSERPHVVLVGFMGCGKTTIGRALAERLGCEFVDLDHEIVESSGSSVREIFRNHGEIAFRARERAALREVLNRKATVVLATGGGTYVDPMMRTWIQEGGRSIFLQASVEVLVGRAGHGEAREQRPLLSGPDPEQTIRRKLAERTPAYELADIAVRTDKARVDQVVDEVLTQLRLERHPAAVQSTWRRRPEARRPEPKRHPATQPVTSGDSHTVRVQTVMGSYRIQFGQTAGPWLADEICRVCPGRRLVFISDETVAALHATALVEGLKVAGKLATLFTVSPGEQSKSLLMVSQLYQKLTDTGVRPEDAVVGLGGGIPMDLAGFLASTYRRGLRLVQLPTTTLAAVDASVGGAANVHHEAGWNLVGTTYPPRAVLTAAAHLSTQPRQTHAAGLVEVVKMAATMDADFFDAFAHDAAKVLAFEPEPLLLTLKRAAGLKAEIINRTDAEAGDCAVLHFGQTIGRAILAGEGADMPNGAAIGLGMLAEAEWAQTEGLSSHLLERLKEVLSILGISSDWRAARINLDVIDAAASRRGNLISLPVVPRIGSFLIRDVPVAALTEFVRYRRTS